MKTFAGAMIAFIIIISGIQTYSFMLTKSVNYMENCAEQIVKSAENENWDDCDDTFRDFKERWSAAGKWLTAFTHHNDMRYINETVSEIEIYISFKDGAQTAAKANLLKNQLKQIPENEKLTLENLL